MQYTRRENVVRCLGPAGFHRMHYCEWGDTDNPHVVVCVHGLARNGRDFDFLAQALADRCRVICPDVVGRGKSDWLALKSGYGYPQYMNDMTTLLARVTDGARHTVDWIGTSMGALLGIFMAAMPESPIRKLVLNDAGTRVPKAALERIGSYVGKDPRFGTLDELEARLRQVAASFGPLTDAHWRHLAAHGAKQHPDGRWGFSYDPAIGDALQGDLQDVDLSPCWNAISCRTLLLRGADSDVLLAETAREMTACGPKAKLVEFNGVGHAPMLMSDDQIAVVREFLLEK
jgi:pimeloyl-ACP methyl ester carboxylesterase